MRLHLAPHGPICLLGEGPRWDEIGQRLLWVDIDTGTLLEGRPDADGLGTVTSTTVGPTVGAIAPAADGTVLAAAHDRLVIVGSDGAVRQQSRQLLGSGHRFNDGAVDPAGRFLVGTLSLTKTTWDEQLLRLEEDGSLTVIDDDLGLSNGLAWSADGSCFYSVDTERRTIFARPYDADTGEMGERRVWAQIADGHPDGIWVDMEDHVWIAIWGDGAVHRYSPRGVRIATVEVPAPHTTSVTFAGPARDIIVIATASRGLSQAQREQYPLSGSLFTAVAPIAGLGCTPWTPGPLPR